MHNDNLRDPHRYIVVEGPIGVGKTSLAKRLGESLAAEMLLEDAQDNPFLERFYQNQRLAALPTQLYFLFQRARQLQGLRQNDMFRPVRVADFLMEKDRLFAQLTLDDDELRLYEQAYTQLTIDAPTPSLVIYLQAPVEVLLERIDKRGLASERLIEAGYLQRLVDAYTNFFYHYNAAPLLIVNATEINPINNEHDYGLLLDHIRSVHSGRHYFNPIPVSSVSAITLTGLRELKRKGEKIACLTAYDASFAQLLEAAGIELLIVGDSLGMVVQGQDSTLPVTVADMIYHTRNVRRGSQRAFIVADLPFMSYASPAQALGNAARLMQEGGAHAVKLEGGAIMADTVRQLSERGIPVCGHLGLLPQSVHRLGGYRVQGRDAQAAQNLLEDAQALEAAGAALLVLEAVPSSLAAKITQTLGIPVIGIGAGVECDGQVLVVYDILGLTPGKPPRFSRNFLRGKNDVAEAVQAYVADVKACSFPGSEHSFN